MCLPGILNQCFDCQASRSCHSAMPWSPRHPPLVAGVCHTPSSAACFANATVSLTMVCACMFEQTRSIEEMLMEFKRVPVEDDRHRSEQERLGYTAPRQQQYGSGTPAPLPAPPANGHGIPATMRTGKSFFQSLAGKSAVARLHLGPDQNFGNLDNIPFLVPLLSHCSMLAACWSVSVDGVPQLTAGVTLSHPCASSVIFSAELVWLAACLLDLRCAKGLTCPF